MATWNELNPGNLLGAGLGRADSGSGGLTSGVSNTVQAAENQAPWYSPDNPLFWFGVALGTVAGLIVFSTTVDVGPVKVKASG